MKLHLFVLALCASGAAATCGCCYDTSEHTIGKCTDGACSEGMMMFDDDAKAPEQYGGHHICSQTFTPANPPDPKLKAATARWIVHSTTWSVISTTSTKSGTSGSAWAQPISHVDGTVLDVASNVSESSTGTPYFYASGLDQSMQDIEANNQVSLALSEVMTGTCQEAGRDPEDPMCARLTLSGTFDKVTDAEEEESALASLFQRHPAMSTWPEGHGFFVGKLSISDIWLIDEYGGASQVDVSDYNQVEMVEDTMGCCYNKLTHTLRTTKCIYSCDKETELGYLDTAIAPAKYGGGSVCASATNEDAQEAA